MHRPNWHTYFMNLAYQASTRATCPRRHVGAVLVKDNINVATGYNGAPTGVSDCYEDGCDLVTNYEQDKGELVKKDHCVRTIHAEQNLILFSTPEQRKGATLYVTDQPCWTCANIIANSGIKEVIFHRPYKKDYKKVHDLFHQKGIAIHEFRHYQTPEFIKKTNVVE